MSYFSQSQSDKEKCSNEPVEIQNLTENLKDVLYVHEYTILNGYSSSDECNEMLSFADTVTK